MKLIPKIVALIMSCGAMFALAAESTAPVKPVSTAPSKSAPAKQSVSVKPASTPSVKSAPVVKPVPPSTKPAAVTKPASVSAKPTATSKPVPTPVKPAPVPAKPVTVVKPTPTKPATVTKPVTAKPVVVVKPVPETVKPAPAPAPAPVTPEPVVKPEPTPVAPIPVPVPVPVPVTPVTSSSDIVVPDNFTLATDKPLTLYFKGPDAVRVNVYSAADSTTIAPMIRPDYSTLIGTFSADDLPKSVTFSPNWKILVLEWLPDGLGSEARYSLMDVLAGQKRAEYPAQ